MFPTLEHCHVVGDGREDVLGHSNQTSAPYLGDEVVHAQSQRKGQVSNHSNSHFAGRQVMH